MQKELRASVIVPTYNGAHKIGGLLESLKNQSIKNFEIIVVIDGSTDGTETVVQRYADTFTSFRVIRQPNKGRSAVRNRGAGEAAAPILIFFDDDMLPDGECVQMHCSFQEQCPSVLCGEQFENTVSYPTDFQRYKAFLTHRWTSAYKSATTRMELGNLFFSAANSSVHKSHFDVLNGFDPRLNDAEDYDFAYRAIEHEIPVFYDKNIKAVHNDPVTCVKFIMRQRAYAKGHAHLNSVHPERQPHRVLMDKSVFARLVYKLASLPFLPRAIDKGVLKFFPKKIRYKLFDVVVHSLSRYYPDVKI
jgi:glycosyltransferase involved in cell wall biosynthesis